METSPAVRKETIPAFAMDEERLINVLRNSLYPGAQTDSIIMVIQYCKASNLDPMQKPVHIVPMWDGKAKTMRDVIMPGIGLYRTQAARSGEYAGVSDPEFGPDVNGEVGGANITYPAWCKVIVKRLLANGAIAEFASTERWLENYAVKGGQDKSIAPNAMWAKRPYAQLAKCAEAQALRKAFPEVGAQPTADEMEGKTFDDDAGGMPPGRPQRQTGKSAAEAARKVDDTEARQQLIADLELVASEQGIDAYAEVWAKLKPAQRKMIGAEEHDRLKTVATSDALREVKARTLEDAATQLASGLSARHLLNIAADLRKGE